MALLFAKNNSLSAVTALPASITGGGLNLISTQTASSSSSISFTSGIDSTYKEYIFKFINIHSSGDNVNFSFNTSVDSGSNYNTAKTTSFFIAGHQENDASTVLDYDTGRDLAQGTGFQKLAYQSGSGNDENLVGTLHLFDPSSTVFMKHFMSRTVLNTYHDYCIESYVAGYLNDTSAIDAVQFKMDSGNIDSGIIKMYGVT